MRQSQANGDRKARIKRQNHLDFSFVIFVCHVLWDSDFFILPSPRRFSSALVTLLQRIFMGLARLDCPMLCLHFFMFIMNSHLETSWNILSSRQSGSRGMKEHICWVRIQLARPPTPRRDLLTCPDTRGSIPFFSSQGSQGSQCLDFRQVLERMCPSAEWAKRAKRAERKSDLKSSWNRVKTVIFAETVESSSHSMFMWLVFLFETQVNTFKQQNVIVVPVSIGTGMDLTGSLSIMTLWLGNQETSANHQNECLSHEHFLLLLVRLLILKWHVIIYIYTYIYIY